MNLSSLQEAYVDLYEDLVQDSSTTLTAFKVTNVTITDVSLDNGRLEVSAKYNYDYTLNYTNYNDEVQTKNGSSSYSSTLTYDYFEDTLKLFEIYGAVGYL